MRVENLALKFKNPQDMIEQKQLNANMLKETNKFCIKNGQSFQRASNGFEAQSKKVVGE